MNWKSDCVWARGGVAALAKSGSGQSVFTVRILTAAEGRVERRGCAPSCLEDSLLYVARVEFWQENVDKSGRD